MFTARSLLLHDSGESEDNIRQRAYKVQVNVLSGSHRLKEKVSDETLQELF